MKKLILVAFFLMAVTISQAQELKWHTDIKEAIKISNKKKKPLMLFFTGSDWCGWCIRLQKEVLKTPEFSKWAEGNVVLVELDYPRGIEQSAAIKKQNGELQQVFGIQGFPTVYFAKAAMNKGGKVKFESLGNTGYVAGGPAAWIQVADGYVKNAKMTTDSKAKKV